jgi:hypothetical protein
MAPPLQPEFFLLLGIDLFLAISLLTCLLDKHFPWQLPYLYQVAGLVGYGNLLASREFMALFGEYMRFWYSFLYLIVALANIIAINAYIGLTKKLMSYAKLLMFTVTFPSLAISALFVVNYTQIAVHPLLMLPPMSWEATFIGIVAFDTFVVGLGTYIFFKPKWWYITLGAGAAIAGASAYATIKPTWGGAAFVGSAVTLAIACVVVLGISLYIFARMWMDSLKEKKRKREVKE